MTDSVPHVSLRQLDDLWFQVAGTVCNLTCNHCFISCGPKNDSFGFLSRDQVKLHLDRSVEMGVREYYFTGGEPFLNPWMIEILELTLQYGPATVLTNGTLLKDGWLQRLARAEEASRYSLEIRVSIDGFSPDTNDPIRGRGTFDRALRGVLRLVEFGFLPIITVARNWSDDKERQVVDQFVRMLREAGYTRPRLKILPTLRMGAEADRAHGYRPTERVTQAMMDGFDQNHLVCSYSRVVTERGVHVCPILIESNDSLLGQSLADATGSFPLAHGPCVTCYQFGAICSNPSAAAGRPERIRATDSESMNVNPGSDH